MVDNDTNSLALDALVGMAYINARKSKFEQALELLTLVNNHNASSFAIKQKATQLWDELVTELPIETVTKAEKVGLALDLRETAVSLLANPPDL